MPRLMDWYIGKTAFGAMVVVTLCGSLLMFVFTLIDAMQDTAGQGSVASAVWQTLRSMPRKIEELAPFAVFLGALIGLGSLSGNSELTVLRSSGVSIFRLFLSACIPSVLMIILAQTLIPIVFASDERSARSQYAGVSSAWVREGDTFTLIGAIDSSEKLSRIEQFRLDDSGGLRNVRSAKSAVQSAAGGGWDLNEVSLVDYSNDDIVLSEKPSDNWVTSRTAESLAAAFTIEPRKMSVVQLSQQIDDLRVANQDPSDYLVEYWMKLTKPLSVLGLVLIAIGFVIGSTREMGMGARLTFGIAVGFAFHYLQTLIAPMSIVFEIPPVVAILVPVLLVWTFGLLLIRRIG